MKEQEATNLTPPVALTEHEAEAVAGGVTLIRLGGCSGCTSGGFLDPRATFAQVISPGEAV